MDKKTGLRASPETCMMCMYKTECLQTALHGGNGLDIREEMVDRAYESKMMGFWERWSKKKEIHREKKEREKKGS